MRNFNITKLDAKGRILIPFHIREYLELGEGTEMMVVNNGDKELKIFPLFKGKSAEIRILMSDALGSLSKTSDIFTKYNVDILMSQSKTIDRGKLAEWSAIVDISQCDDIKKFKNEIRCLKIVKKFQFVVR